MQKGSAECGGSERGGHNRDHIEGALASASAAAQRRPQVGQLVGWRAAAPPFLRVVIVYDTAEGEHEHAAEATDQEGQEMGEDE
ncbi:hypothetical protein GCM10017643_01770 [Ancylobacter dichloromethanicus]|uniref:Uncharacterized protein n=1 Tax=Ancylobacter dichloromethanicus TaxID=518825 RepID=A0A9W6MXN0_9HYPH|nr:hypothetical protein GCM10017643_01770 [Ancylobacter dichloromethanicus]